jgi:hypothetical protein
VSSDSSVKNKKNLALRYTCVCVLARTHREVLILSGPNGRSVHNLG